MKIKELIKVSNYYQVKYNFKINAQVEPKVFYTGLVFDDSSMSLLRSKLKDVSTEECADWLLSNIGSHGHEQLNHHMTLAAKPAFKIKDLDLSLLDSEFSVDVIGFGIDYNLGIAGWKVSTNLPVESGNPHVTALLANDSVKPFLAGKIKDWKPIEPFTIKGILTEVK